MRTTILSFCLIYVLFGISYGQVKVVRSHVERYTSPDKTIIATITFTKVSEAAAESRIELHTTSGKILARVDYSSKDREHGYGVVKATWTPDSQYFVYSLLSSGGHQLWHSPIKFFSRKQNKIFSLDDALHDAVTNPHFDTVAPDIVTVQLYFKKEKYNATLSELHTGD